MGWLETFPVVSQFKSLVQAACGDLKGAEQTQIEFANACSAIPVLSQCKSAVQAAYGDMEAAAKTQDDFSKQCAGVSQLRSAVEVSLGHTEEARKTQVEFYESPGFSQMAVFAPMAAGPALAAAAISAAGFGTGGIAAGSAAAGLMSSYGGTVAAGSLCAVLQSAGAVGLSAGLTTAAVAAGGVVGVGVAAACDAAKEESKIQSATEGTPATKGESATRNEADRNRIMVGQECECAGRYHHQSCHYHPEHALKPPPSNPRTTTIQTQTDLSVRVTKLDLVLFSCLCLVLGILMPYRSLLHMVGYPSL
ncbi:hypothetical protein DFS34DRAFT_185823 [Phlyctochytrium arcticum]|nr:hypothetical protein DFS34DRAFT_185823 [Phlyctochytrium arcticum]